MLFSQLPEEDCQGVKLANYTWNVQDLSLYAAKLHTVDREVFTVEIYSSVKLNMRKIKMRVRAYMAEPLSDKIFLTRKFKPQISFNAKIFSNLRYLQNLCSVKKISIQTRFVDHVAS